MRKVLVRKKIRERDCLPDYPTNVRIGDTRTGNRTVFFDDTNTVVFHQTGTISMPVAIPAGSKVLTSDLTSSITFTGRSALNTFHRIEPIAAQEQPITPFKELKLFEQDNRSQSFYMTGTSISEVGLGLSQPLSAKTIIRFEIPITSEFNLMPTTASLNYFNFARGTFETVGDYHRPKIYTGVSTTEYSGPGWDAQLFGPFGNVQMSASSHPNLTFLNTAAPHPFYNTDTSIASIADVLQFQQPQIFNFRYAGNSLLNSRAAATSSHVLSASNITQPFVLEKIIVEMPFKAGVGWFEDKTRFYVTGSNIDAPDIGGPCVTFSLLNQFAADKRDIILSATIIPSYDNITRANVHIEEGAEGKRMPEGFRCFGTPSVTVTSGSTGTFTGSVRFEAESTVSNGILGFTYGLTIEDPEYNMGILGPVVIANIDPFGRSMSGTPSGRSIYGGEFATPDITKVATSSANVDLFGTLATSDVQDFNVYNFEKTVKSPYLILPGDKLIVALAKHRSTVTDPVGYSSGTNTNLSKSHDVGIPTGTLYISMFGSMLRQGVETHQTLNQPLNTNAVHETLFGSPVADQFDVEFESSFTGSYIDDYLFGSLTPTTNRTVVMSRTRMRQGGTIFNSRELTDFSDVSYGDFLIINKLRGFSRNSTGICFNERFYDTLLPSIAEITKINGSEAHQSEIDPTEAELTLDIQYISSMPVDHSWTKSFPFEAKYSGIRRSSNLGSITVTRSSAGAVLNKPFVTRKYSVRIPSDDARRVAHPTGSVYRNISKDGLSYVQSSLTEPLFLRCFFGIGDSNSVTVTTGSYCGTQNMTPGLQSLQNFISTNKQMYLVAPVVRGWKYGILNGLPQYNKCVFRQSRFGQFRDMLEQRKDGKFFDNVGGTRIIPGPRSGPVQVKFRNHITRNVVRPEQTNSSNLSFEATSSVPYCDGMVRNREDPMRVSSLGTTVVSLGQ